MVGIVIKEVQDGNANLFPVQFYDDGSGNLKAIQHVDDSQVAELAQETGGNLAAIAASSAATSTQATATAGSTASIATSSTATAAVLGTTADASPAAGAVGTISGKLRLLSTLLNNLLSAASSAIAAGSNYIGQIGVASVAYSASGVAPVVGSFTAIGYSAAFTPAAGRAFNLSGWGTFTANVQLERSFDGGTTRLPITAAGQPLYLWSAPFSEAAGDDEFGVLYFLHCTAYVSGTLNYRLST